MIVLLILGVLTLAILGLMIKYYFDKMFILRAFKKGNIIVYGNKGKGKDLVFQKVIKWRKKEKYLSNLDYGWNYENIALKSIDINNDYNNFIHENINLANKQDYENKDIYISDTGVYLPSQHDSTLHKTYKSFPIFYALSRQLYHNNVHTNVQNLEREWKALREIGDGFIWSRKTIKVFGLLITFCVYYDKYQTAVNKLLPMKKPKMLEGRSVYEQYKATNGIIRKFFIINRIKTNKYDTRAFHEKVFGYKAN